MTYVVFFGTIVVFTVIMTPAFLEWFGIVNVPPLLPDSSDKAQPPEPKPKKPTLESATLYVSGANGEPYKVSWTVDTPKGDTLHEHQATGVIKDEPTAYPIDLEGFRRDHNENAFMSGDLYMEATKTEPWQGDLNIVLEVNDTLVECETMSETHPEGGSEVASLGFDADSGEAYSEDFMCDVALQE